MSEISETSEKEVLTPELTLERAKKAGEQIRTIKENYPLTAAAISTHSRLLPDQKWSDPDAMIAKLIMCDFEYGLEENSRRRVHNIFDGTYKGVDIPRLNSALVKLDELTSDPSPESLHTKMLTQKKELESQIINDQGSGIDTYLGLVKHYRAINQSIAELKPHLPST